MRISTVQFAHNYVLLFNIVICYLKVTENKKGINKRIKNEIVSYFYHKTKITNNEGENRVKKNKNKNKTKQIYFLPKKDKRP